MAAIEGNDPRMNVKSELVIKSLQRQLSEANMQVAVLEAQILQMQEDAATAPPESFNEDSVIAL